MVTIDRRQARARACGRTPRCSARSRGAGSSAPAPRRVAPYDRALHTGGPLEGAEIPGYTAAGPGRAGQGRRTACSPASAGSATTSSSSSRWPPTAPSRSARSATTGRSPRSRPSARTSPTTSRRRSPWSPTRRSTASARSSTSRPAPCSAAGRRCTTRPTDTDTVETSFPVILGGHHDLAPLSDDDLPRDRPRAPDLPARGPLGGVPRPRPRRSTSPCSSPRPPQGAIERLKQEAVKAVRDGAELLVLTDRTVYDGERRYLDPHLATSAIDQALKHVPGRARRGEPAPPLLDRAALGGDPQRPRRRARARPRRQRRQPVRDARGRLRRRLRAGRRQHLRRRSRKGIEKVISTIGIHEVRGYARQFSSIGIKPELAEIFQTEAFAASADGRRRLRRARRRHRRAPRDPRAATTTGRSRRRRSASTPRSTRPRSRPRTAPASYEEYSAEGARARGRRARSRCATSSACGPIASRSTRRRSTPASATTTTRS